GATPPAPPGDPGAWRPCVTRPATPPAPSTSPPTPAPRAPVSFPNPAAVPPPAGTTDASPGNNSFTDTDNLTPRADLQVTITDGATTIVPGTPDTYIIVVSNNGPSTAVGAEVSDLFPSVITSATWTAVASAGSSVGAVSG